MSSAHTKLTDTDTDEAQRVTDFWFGLKKIDWFTKNPELDQKIQREFGPLLAKARNNELDGWTSTPKTALALIILLDQFTRNCFRGSHDSFSSDAKAAGIATQAIAQDFEKQFPTEQAQFFYLPLEHTESLVSQVATVALYEGLLARCKEQLDKDATNYMKLGLTSAKLHRDVIMEFGRFPGRNKALGRQNTPEEDEFLKQNPSGLKPLPKEDMEMASSLLSRN